MTLVDKELNLKTSYTFLNTSHSFAHVIDIPFIEFRQYCSLKLWGEWSRQKVTI